MKKNLEVPDLLGFVFFEDFILVFILKMKQTDSGRLQFSFFFVSVTTVSLSLTSVRAFDYKSSS